MFKIRIWYDEIIGHEDVSEAFGIMCIDCGKNIGCSLDNQMIENFITNFLTNIVFQHVGLFWIIELNQNTNFYFQMKSFFLLFFVIWSP